MVLLFGIFGILYGITAIPAVIIGNRVLRKIDAQPARYSGRTRVKVGLILGWLFIGLYAFLIVVSVIVGITEG